MTSREELQQFVMTLPDGALPQAHAALQRLQAWTPPAPPVPTGREAAREWLRDMSERHQARIQARMSEMRERNPDQCFAVLGGGGGHRGPRGTSSRHSFGYRDGEDDVYETAIVHENHELVLVERRRIDRPARKLVFALQVTGPDGATARLDRTFDVALRAGSDVDELTP